MLLEVTIDQEIDDLKQRLVETAEHFDFNLLHPSVQQISQELDLLIVQHMKSGFES